MKRDGIVIKGHRGTWYVIDEQLLSDGKLDIKVFMLEHEEYGEDAQHLFVDENMEIVPALTDIESFEDAHKVLAHNSWAEVSANVNYFNIIGKVEKILEGSLYYIHEDMEELHLNPRKFYLDSDTLCYQHYFLHRKPTRYLKIHAKCYGEWIEVGDFEFDYKDILYGGK